MRQPLKNRLFNAGCFQIGRTARSFGYKLQNPCFVIGTGRCGTTLFVRILESHPHLSAFPGEANELWHPKLEPFEAAELGVPPIEVDPGRFTEVSVASWPADHAERIRNIFTGFNLATGPSRVFFSKSAMISFMIPKILEIFPTAKLIHIYRSGPSVIESYFKKNFGKYSRFVFTERDYRLYCARYWNACILEIEEQRRRLSLDATGRFFEFSYEDLCRDPRTVLDDVAAFLRVAPDAFSFDLATVASRNYKAAYEARNPDTAELLDVISEGMTLKNYLSYAPRTAAAPS